MSTEFFKQARQRGITHIGQAWYEAKDFKEAMAVMEDRQNLFTNHTEWLQAAMGMEENIRSAGLIPVRAAIRATDFAAYCRAGGLRVNAEGRNTYANLVAHQRQAGGIS